MSGNYEEQQRQKRLAEQKRKEYDKDMRKVLSLPEGRRFIWRLIDDTCRAHASAFGHNPGVTAYNTGVRDIGLHLMREVERLEPRHAVHMYQEQLEAKAGDKLLRTDAEAKSQAEAEDEYGGDSNNWS